MIGWDTSSLSANYTSCTVNRVGPFPTWQGMTIVPGTRAPDPSPGGNPGVNLKTNMATPLGTYIFSVQCEGGATDLIESAAATLRVVSSRQFEI